MIFPDPDPDDFPGSGSDHQFLKKIVKRIIKKIIKH